MGSWTEESTGQYLNAKFVEDLLRKHKKQDMTVTITSCLKETVGQDDERKLVLRFENGGRAMILNKTNGDTLADAYGDDYDTWAGHEITLFVVPNVYQGKPGLRVRPPVPVVSDEEFTADALSGDDGLPF